MSQHRNYFHDDLSFSQWHRKFLSELYVRIGHRLTVADRDWTEFCHYCSEPLAIYETVRDKGQNLFDKATTVTRKLAGRANLDAFLVAYKISRPDAVQKHIDYYSAKIRQLEEMHPIEGFQVRDLSKSECVLMPHTPTEFAQMIAIQHRSHHVGCSRAREFPVQFEKLLTAWRNSPRGNGKLFLP